jgi:hypothetical protein
MYASTYVQSQPCATATHSKTFKVLSRLVQNHSNRLIFQRTPCMETLLSNTNLFIEKYPKVLG